jgi:type II secretory pathway predicted ATPase ExeA
MPNQSLPLTHWGLERWPFCSTPGERQFYPTEGHNEALARIEYLVDGRRRLGALLGGSGVGKSLVLRVAEAQLARKGRAVVLVDALGSSTREFLWQVACGLGTTPREDADAPWLWRQITDRIAENRAREVDTVLLVDDAGQAGPDLVTQFLRLARLDVTPAARWTIVLAAEPEQAARWNDGLRNLFDLRIDVLPWTADDTIGYVQTALVEAGRLEPLFDHGALEALHELASGVPRQVTRLADYALLAGAVAGVETIDRAIVAGASDEIAWPRGVAVEY